MPPKRRAEMRASEREKQNEQSAQQHGKILEKIEALKQGIIKRPNRPALSELSKISYQGGSYYQAVDAAFEEILSQIEGRGSYSEVLNFRIDILNDPPKQNIPVAIKIIEDLTDLGTNGIEGEPYEAVKERAIAHIKDIKHYQTDPQVQNAANNALQELTPNKMDLDIIHAEI